MGTIFLNISDIQYYFFSVSIAFIDVPTNSLPTVSFYGSKDSLLPYYSLDIIVLENP